MGALAANRSTRHRTGNYLEIKVYAGQHIYAGSLVCIRTDGYAVPGADTATLQFMGVAVNEADNTLGASGAIKVMVQTDGVHLFAATGLAQTDTGLTVYASDDQTVKVAAGNAVIVGQIVQVESALLAWVDIKSAIVIGATLPGGAVTVADATNIITATKADAALSEIMTGIKTAQYLIQPDGAPTLETGGPTAVFANAGADGFTQLTNKEVALRWNNAASPTKMAARFTIPPDMDLTKVLVVHFLGAIIRAAGAADVPTMTVEAYFSESGVAPSVPANCGGTTVAWAATTAYQEVTLTIAVVSIPSAASVLTVIFNPTDGTLPADDFALAGIWLEGTRKCLTS